MNFKFLSSIFGKAPEPTAQEKLISALKICQQAIEYCEKEVLAQIQRYAEAHPISSQPIEFRIKNGYFPELHTLYFNNHWFVQNSIVELYNKRDIFLDLQAQLIGKQPEDFQGALSLIGDQTKKLKISDYGYQLNLVKLTLPGMKKAEQSIARDSSKINTLKETVNNILINKTSRPDIHESTTRLKAANQYFNADKIATLKTFRDTSDTDGLLVGLVKKLGRLLISITKAIPNSAKDIQPLQKCFS